MSKLGPIEFCWCIYFCVFSGAFTIYTRVLLFRESLVYTIIDVFPRFFIYTRRSLNPLETVFLSSDQLVIEQ